MHLSEAAVREDQVRHLGELLIPCMREPSKQNLSHRRVVILSLDRLDLEETVCLLIRAAVRKDHHTAAAVVVSEVTDIIGFDALRNIPKRELIAEKSQCRLDALLRGAYPQDPPAQRFFRICICHLQEPRAIASLRNMDRDLMSGHVADRLLDGVVILEIDRHEDLFRDLRRCRVILHQEGFEETVFRLSLILQKIGGRTDDTAFTKFQFSKTHFARIAEKAHGVTIRLARERYILVGHDGTKRI